ncbi:MAG: sterol desaturase/sphingolipid hydroxylase (fatty acid hydroxylase superfamily) [Maribacter sp.]|jgi:sterol desaturase/sphingolipid hydroxylase (fatty acid hydroxylase superfamily)
MSVTTKREDSIIQKILLYTWYPAILFTAVFLAIYLIREGYNDVFIIGSISVMAMIFIFIMEYLNPEHKEWQASGKVMKHDFLHMLITSVVPTRLFEFLLRLALPILGIWGATYVGGLGIWPGTGDMSYLSLFLQMLLAIHLGDLGYYILHRSLHEIPRIWPFHAVHHSPEQLYVIAANRAHPIQIFFTYGVQIAILYTMGISSEALLMFSVFVSVNGQLQHCNIRMRCSIFNWIFATADLHRWHHSIEIAESNSNYGNNVVLWDILFGTRFLPSKVTMEHDRIGLPPGTAFPETFWGHVMAPFRWENIRYDRDQVEE